MHQRPSKRQLPCALGRVALALAFLAAAPACTLRVTTSKVLALSYSGSAGTTAIVNQAMQILPSELSGGGRAIVACRVQANAASWPSTLSVDAGTCRIHGTPTSVLPTTRFTIVATDDAGSTTSAVLSLTVVAGAPILKYAATVKAGTVGLSLRVPPEALETNGASLTACGVQPGTNALPQGLSIDPATCVLGGTPSAPFDTQSFKVIAKNAGGSSSEATLSLRVLPPFAYVTNGDLATVTMINRDKATGNWQLLQPPTVATGPGAAFVTADPSSRFAYVVNQGDSTISTYRIDAMTGALSSISTPAVPTDSLPSSMAFHPSGKFAYVANHGNPRISMYSVNADTGVLSPLSPAFVSAAGWTSSIALDPAGKFAYVANCSYYLGDPHPLIYQVDASTGLLTAVATPNLPAAPCSTSVAIDPQGRFAYFANEGDSSISIYSIDRATGMLVPGTPPKFSAEYWTGYGFPSTVTVHPTGRTLFVGSSVTGLGEYRIDAETGQLSGPIEVRSVDQKYAAVDASGQSVLAPSDAAIGALSIDLTTGLWNGSGNGIVVSGSPTSIFAR